MQPLSDKLDPAILKQRMYELTKLNVMYLQVLSGLTSKQYDSLLQECGILSIKTSHRGKNMQFKVSTLSKFLNKYEIKGMNSNDPSHRNHPSKPTT